MQYFLSVRDPDNSQRERTIAITVRNRAKNGKTMTVRNCLRNYTMGSIITDQRIINAALENYRSLLREAGCGYRAVDKTMSRLTVITQE